jgi:hypothetical protein
MKRLALLVLLVAPVAAADVMDNDNNHNVTVDCKKDPGVDIAGNKNTYKLKGECKQLRVSGNDNHITGDSITSILVSGNSNTVATTATDQIAISGDRNTVTWKKASAKGKTEPGLMNSGDGNKITQAK